MDGLMGLLDYFIIVQYSFFSKHPQIFDEVFQKVAEVLVCEILKSIFFFICAPLFEPWVI
jgi:hypothetical protein